MLPVLNVAMFAFSAFNLLKGAFVLSIPLFIVSLLGSFIHRKITKKFKVSWIVAALAVVGLFSLLFILYAYLYPLYYGFGAAELEMPPEFEPDLDDHFGLAGVSLFRVFFGTVIVAAIAMPFVLLGSLFKDWLEKRKWNKYICLSISVFICTAIASALFLFLFGWVLQGMIYFLYSG